jgi:ubiquinone biosynthesis protein UbiJ
MMLSPLFLTAFTSPAESLINLALKQDPVTLRAIAHFSGKAMHIQCSGPIGWQVYMLIGESGIALQSVYEGPTNAKISGSIAALAQLALSKQQSQALFKGDISMSGDTTLVQEFYAAFKNLDIDWEDHFARLFGDITTNKASAFARDTKQWSSNSLDALMDDTEEYLHEEARLLPTRGEVKRFANDLDELRLGIDRIAARIAAIGKNLA